MKCACKKYEMWSMSPQHYDKETHGLDGCYGDGWGCSTGFMSMTTTTTVPETQASKNDSEKPDLSLIPYSAQIAEAKAMMIGAAKYGRYNYTKGHEASQLVAAAQRHLLAWFSGEENDPVDGQPHLGSVRACIGMLIEQQNLGTLKDNRFKKETK